MGVATLKLFDAIRLSLDNVVGIVRLEVHINIVEETVHGRQAHDSCNLAKSNETINVYVYVVNTGLDGEC